MRKLISNIKGMEKYDDYAITSDGDVLSYKKKNVRVLKGHKNLNGKPGVGLSSRGKSTFFLIEILVLNAFIHEYRYGLVINHKDKDETNNNYENLEYIPRKYDNKMKKEYLILNKLIGVKIIQLTLKDEFIKEWESIMEIEEVNGYWRNNIAKVCNGESENCDNYHWKYKD
jgi:hypothetical protein